jgi:predicted ATP-binding protein involved in virulence
MRLRRLTLKDFRGFAELDLEFPESAQTTVLVGINGAGKTSILDAIGFALYWGLQDFSGYPGTFAVESDDIRSGQATARIGINATIADDSGRKILEWDLATARSSSGELKHTFESNPKQGGRNVRDVVLAHYTVDRLVRINDASIEGGMQVDSVDFTSFFTWFESREDLENERIRENPGHRDVELEAVRQAIQNLLPNISNLRVRRGRVQKGQPAPRSKLVVTKGSQVLELGQLSHGERGLLAMTGDIGRGLALTGPESVEPRLRAGIVLIDEIELHLHPAWQREVIARLESTFPNVQFIVTTHSPQVIGQMQPESVKVFENFKLVTAAPHTHGRDANAILSDIMGVSEWPAFAAKWLNEIAGLIDDERWDEARARLRELSARWGEQAPEVLRFRTMIDLLEDPGKAAE